MRRLKGHPDGTTSRDVAELAADLGLSQATAYRLIKIFRGGGTVLSLVDRKRGRPEGHLHYSATAAMTVISTLSSGRFKRDSPQDLAGAQPAGNQWSQTEFIAA